MGHKFIEVSKFVLADTEDISLRNFRRSILVTEFSECE